MYEFSPMKIIRFIIFLMFLFFSANIFAQEDSTIIKEKKQIDTSLSKKKLKNLKDSTSRKEKKTGAKTFSFKKDTTPVKFHDPHIATRRSAILPGWGQAYNRDYWKIPVVYGVLAIPAATWAYNNAWYKRTRDAYNIVINGDTANYPKIDFRLQPLVGDPSTLQYYRNYFRKSRDYSVLYFLLAWGLNVADATVFAHLKGFDVSDDLSLNIQPTISPSANGTNLGFNFSLKNSTHKILPVW